jgi:hypothetical protein
LSHLARDPGLGEISHVENEASREVDVENEENAHFEEAEGKFDVLRGVQLSDDFRKSEQAEELKQLQDFELVGQS